MISFKLTPDSKKFIRYLKDRKKRVRSLLADISFQAAQELYMELYEKLPKTPEWDSVREALTIKKVAIKSYSQTAYVVCLGKKPRGRKIGSLDQKTTAVYVVPARSRKRKTPTVSTLVQFGPWTLDTMPLFPKRQDARVMYRKVSPQEIEAVRTRVTQTEEQWRKQLYDAGVRAPKLQKLPRRKRVEADWVGQALRLEYGGAGTGGKAIWRPAIRRIAKSGGRILRSRKVVNHMARPNFRGFLVVPSGDGTVPVRYAQGLEHFQKRLRL